MGKTRQDGVRCGERPSVPFLATQPPGTGRAQCLRKARSALREQELRALASESGFEPLLPSRGLSPSSAVRSGSSCSHVDSLCLTPEPERRGQLAGERRGVGTREDPAGSDALIRS